VVLVAVICLLQPVDAAKKKKEAKYVFILSEMEWE